MDLNAILWTLIVGIPILLWFIYWSIGLLFPIFEWLRPKPKARQPVQRTLAEWMDDTFPYLKRWVEEEYLEEEIQLMDAEEHGYEALGISSDNDPEFPIETIIFRKTS